jgi:hypothetical protein
MNPDPFLTNLLLFRLVFCLFRLFQNTLVSILKRNNRNKHLVLDRVESSFDSRFGCFDTKLVSEDTLVEQFFPASVTSWSPRAALHISIQNMTGAALITSRYHENSNDSILQPKHKNFKGRLEN